METIKKAFLLLFLLVVTAGFDARQMIGNRKSIPDLNTMQHENPLDLNPHVKIEIYMATETYTEDISYPAKDKICPAEDRMCFAGEEHNTESVVHPLESQIKEGRKGMLIIDVRIRLNGREVTLSVPLEVDYDNRGQKMVWRKSIPDFPEITPIDYNELRSRALDESCVNTDESPPGSLYSDIYFPSEELQKCLYHAFDTGLKPICDHERKLRQFLESYKGREGYEDIVRVITEDLLFNTENKYVLASEIYTIAENFDKICKSINIENGIYEEANHHRSPVWDEMGGFVELAAYSWGGTEEIKKHNIALGSTVCAFTVSLNEKARSACGIDLFENEE